MGWFDNGWGLSLIVFLPLVGAVAVLFTPKKNEAAIKAISLGFTAVTLVLAAFLAFRFDFGNSDEFQFGTDLTWIESINSSFHIGVDGISLPLLVLSAFVTILAVIYSFNHWPEPHNPKGFMALTLVLATGMNGTFVALDLVLFFVFFELVLLPMYFMIGDKAIMKIPGFNREVETRLYASIKFFLFTLFGSAFMLLGFLALYFKSGGPGARTFDIPGLIDLAPNFTGTFAFLVFAALFVGFAVKVPMWPLHTWLPDAHTAAPTVGSVLLAAILLKLGAYGFIRISIPILPEMAKQWAPAIAILAVIGIIYGSLACLAQTDMKRLIAFSSVGHMGFVMLGIASMTPVGMNAAIIGMVAHGVITGLLFFLAGSMSHRYHTRDMARLGGNMKVMPIMGGILGFTAMASLGLPGLNGFISEYMVVQGTWPIFSAYTALAMIGLLITGAYILKAVGSVLHGPLNESWAGHNLEINRREVLAIAPLMVLMLSIGVWPLWILRVIEPTVSRLFG